LFGLVILGVAVVLATLLARRRADATLKAAERDAVEQSAAAARITLSHHDVVSETRVPSGFTFAGVLRDAGLAPDLANEITSLVQPVASLRKLRAGQRIIFTRRWDGKLNQLEYRNGWDSEVRVVRNGATYSAREERLDATEEIKVVEATLDSSLFESVLAAGEHPELAVRLAEIFAFDLDFYTDPQPGDTFRLVFEKRTVPGDEVPAYGRIFAAEYVNGRKPFDAVLFHDSSGKPAYFTADGKSLQKAFLKSPLKFAARVSSHFSRHRFHPVAKVYRPHLGTDYAAPIGTPVQAVANGRVEFAARKGGNGNLVVLKHNNGYESYYLHLSRILVRSGQSIQQGQRIGLVGMTGLASGPHLDFRLRRNNSFVDWEHMKLPSWEPVSTRDLTAFETVRNKWIGALHGSADKQKLLATSTAD
jgi:murein DD-endopeptidase MepM/ murein hydrolase activator NlpD